MMIARALLLAGGLLLISSLVAGAIELPVTLTEATLDVTGDGKPDHIRVRMTAGRRYVDEPWCGGGDKYEGRFTLSVQVSGGPVVEHDLNRLMAVAPDAESLFFRAEPWRLASGDYNADGRLDFNIGRYGTCSGWDYRLFTVDDAGSVKPLSVRDGFFHVHDRAHSSERLRSVDGTISLERYSNVTFEWWEFSYSWSAEQGMFLRSGERFLRRQD